MWTRLLWTRSIPNAYSYFLLIVPSSRYIQKTQERIWLPTIHTCWWRPWACIQKLQEWTESRFGYQATTTQINQSDLSLHSYNLYVGEVEKLQTEYSDKYIQYKIYEYMTIILIQIYKYIYNIRTHTHISSIYIYIYASPPPRAHLLRSKVVFCYY